MGTTRDHTDRAIIPHPILSTIPAIIQRIITLPEVLQEVALEEAVTCVEKLDTSHALARINVVVVEYRIHLKMIQFTSMDFLRQSQKKNSQISSVVSVESSWAS